MAQQLLTPSELGDQYLQVLKNLKPEVDISRTDSDWWIRSRIVGGMMAGIYADQKKIADDAFPQSARREALEKHLIMYFNEGFIQPTKAKGIVMVTGLDGSSVPAGTQFVYTPNGNAYQATTGVVLSGVTGAIPVESVTTGQGQNLLDGAGLELSTPPAGIDPSAVALGNISDGRNIESNEEAAQRILNRIQQPPAGGTANDYETFAKEASDSVVDVNVIRFIYGLGTIGIVITAGTTDIDEAIDNGQPVVRMPSQQLIDDVQAYMDAVQVLTDCVYVLSPTQVTVDVNCQVRFLNGSGITIPPGQTLTQAELVEREIRRAIYKTPPGGRQFGASGFVVASEIEEAIDAGLSAQPYTLGEYAEILVDRQVQIVGGNPNKMINANEIVEPGTITVTEM